MYNFTIEKSIELTEKRAKITPKLKNSQEKYQN